MKNFKVVITDCDQGNVNQEIEELKKIDADVIWLEDIKFQDIANNKKGLTEYVLSKSKDADALITQYFKVTSDFVKNLNKCKIISHYGVGCDPIDIPACTEKKMYVCNTPDYCMEDVAIHTLALLFAAIRKIPYFDREIRNGIWDIKRGYPMYRPYGRILGLAGFGRIARTVAKKAQEALGLKVIAYDPYVKETDMDVTLVDFETLIKESDYLSIHMPLTEETKHIFNMDTFKKMKKNVVLLNMGRGPIVNEEDLYLALKEKVISYAALDVQEIEPLPKDSPLIKLDNIILTPHVAYYSEESIDELKRKVAISVVEALTGKVPKYAVNKGEF